MLPMTRAGLTALILAASPAAGAQEPPAPKPVVPKDWSAMQRPLIQKLDVEAAWKITRGDPAVVVGVIDYGFDYFHPDLKGQLTPGYYYPGGYHGESFVEIAHGTLVSSLIVAQGDRPGTMTGLAPDCRVLTASQGMIENRMAKLQSEFFRKHPNATLKDFQSDAQINTDMEKAARDWITYQVGGAADAIRYLVDHGVRVINFSGLLSRRTALIAEPSWRKLEEAVEYAVEKNVVIVLAAGNNAERWDDYPGTAETVIVAGASKLDDTPWFQEDVLQGTKIRQGSNSGKRITVMAPVQDLVVCMPHEPRFYQNDDGPMGPSKVPFKETHGVQPIGATSAAAPIVAALAALVRSARPDLDVRTVVAIVQRGCDDIGAPGFDEQTGHGRANFGKTLRLARDWKRSGP